ncbi:MAG: hypothetical protein GWM87_01360 [Xanthomonadales bacterium]|nr:hypothetical protein [Xanthomonadales bacterium]NIX11733.1 hypothetical protein [Xanthomonadales bacterium]
MNTRSRDEQDLVNAIHGLPRSMKPGRDLWPGILARLGAGGERSGERLPGWRWQALAASLALVFAAGVMLGRQMEQEALPYDGPQTAGLAMLAALEASEREYQAAFREFIPVGAARPMLEAQAVENIENSWFEIQQAESALLAALNEYPDNPFLNQKLMDLRAQQLGFMQQLAMLDQFSRRKT